MQEAIDDCNSKFPLELLEISRIHRVYVVDVSAKLLEPSFAIVVN
jgi:hypothetical protein